MTEVQEMLANEAVVNEADEENLLEKFIKEMIQNGSN